MDERFIPVAAPMLIGNEKKYVMDCLDSSWISSSGKYLEMFESAFAEFCQVKHAISCCNGTIALHLALEALGVGPGDEVIVPTLTFVATANAVRYCGAQPIFVDVEASTWNLDPALLEEKITPRTKGIIPVHLYGLPAEMDAIMAIARRHDLFVLEDAAEAHGAEYHGTRVGSIGDIGTFSFYGNKVVTTGEGGMLTTNDDSLAKRARRMRNQGTDPNRRYWFPIIGYNYRMTNVAAAIGLAQMEKVDWHLQRRQEIAAWYKEQCEEVSGLEFQTYREGVKHIYWMFSLVLTNFNADKRDELMVQLLKLGIETRPVFYPMHVLPQYLAVEEASYPVADRISQAGLSLPTWAGMSREDVCRVVDSLSSCLRETKQEEAVAS